MPTKASKRQPPKSQQNASKTPVGPIPSPLLKVPEALVDFVDELDKEKVYITHIDTQPVSLKKQAFYSLLVLNLLAGSLLAWRAYVIIPVYWSYILTILGNRTEYYVDPHKTSGTDYVGIIGRRFLVILLDYLLVSLVLPWPVSFFFDVPANPCLWRWRIGFKDEELVVRASRQWAAKDLVGSANKGADHPFWVTKVLPAIRKELITTKTGYATQGQNWVFDFEETLWAENLVKQRKNSLSDFQARVLVFMEQHGWLVYTPEWVEEDITAEDTSRAKITEFKDKLTAMGKESLFFRWIELIQYHTSLPGGFTAARKEETLSQARDVFERQGVDFDKFTESIGGLKGLPGMHDQA